MEKFCKFVADRTALWVLLAAALGALAPATLAWLGPWVGYLLGVVMFGMGMTLTVADFRRVLAHPKGVALGAAAQFTLMPLIAWALVKVFGLPPELAIGVILVGTCPGGTASNVIAYLARGDVALSVSMTMTTTLLAPLVTPFMTWALAGAWIDISLTAMMISIAQMVLAPLLLGLACHHFLARQTECVLPLMPLVSVATIVLLVGCVVALSSERLLEVGALMAAVVVLHNALGLTSGYLLARLARLGKEQSRTVAIEVGMQNSGLAASLSVLYFTPAAAIPAAIFSVWHNISGSLFANFCAHRDAKAREGFAGAGSKLLA